jgi:hypothetical protein
MKNYVLIGDIHSQYHQLNDALTYIENNIENYFIVFLGDLFDSRISSSNSVGVYESVKYLQKNNQCVVLQSNHQDKCIRYLKGHNVYTNNGLDRTIQDFDEALISKNTLLEWLSTFPYGIAFKDKNGIEYRCSHAYFSSKLYVPTEYEKEEHHISIVGKHTKSKCLYGLVYENKRVEWWNQETDRDWIRVAGHYHALHIDLTKTKSIILDGECGGEGGLLCIYDVNQQIVKSF